MFLLLVYCVLATLPLGLVHGAACECPSPPSVHGSPGRAASTPGSLVGLYLQGESPLSFGHRPWTYRLKIVKMLYIYVFVLSENDLFPQVICIWKEMNN